jgi:predicted DNA-binding ribbon-helix-helix protein
MEAALGSHPLSSARQELTREPSAIVKRSVVVAGHKTSVTLEDAFWTSLKSIARSRNMSLSEIVGHIDGLRGHGNLSSSIRLFVLECVRAQSQTSVGSVTQARRERPVRHTMHEC